MKIPEILKKGCLKIGGHEYKVLYPHTFTETSRLQGLHTQSTRTINIAGLADSEPLPESSIAVTFIHEILHAIDNNSGNCIFSSTEGEKHLEAISEGLYQVLSDNNLDFRRK